MKDINKKMTKALTSQYMSGNSPLREDELSYVILRSIYLKDSDSVLSLLFIKPNIPQVLGSHDDFLHLAIKNLSPAIVDTLIKYHNNSDLNHKNAEGFTPLELARNLKKELDTNHDQDPNSKVKINEIISLLDGAKDKGR